MVRWLRKSGATADQTPQAEVCELLVVEGADAGQRFTLEGSIVAIRRGSRSVGRPGEILLTDPTVSSRQAWIRATGEGLFIEHREGATNPTLVNGREIVRQRIEPGDCIGMGRIVLEVHSRRGLSLSDMVRPREEPPTDVQRPEPGSTKTWPSPTELTEVRRLDTPEARLTVVHGVPGWEGRRFDVGSTKTSIGRDLANKIYIPEKGVSRRHAELFWEEGQLVLVHCSGTNPTHVNGRAVVDRQVLKSGDEIRLADQVVLSLDLGAPEPETVPEAERESHEASLLTVMEEKIRRDREIDEKYGFIGSFLDVDVVDSYGLKAQASRPEYIILSFERFRAFAGRVVEEFEGHVLNSNGDELMCFFESPLQAVRCASALRERLDAFNTDENLLGRPFRVRQGVHTGNSLVDRKRGVAYSPVLDIAGHLQKHADKNGVLISEATLEALPDGLPLERAGELEKERIPTYRLTDSIE